MLLAIVYNASFQLCLLLLPFLLLLCEATSFASAVLGKKPSDFLLVLRCVICPLLLLSLLLFCEFFFWLYARPPTPPNATTSTTLTSSNIIMIIEQRQCQPMPAKARAIVAVVSSVTTNLTMSHSADQKTSQDNQAQLQTASTHIYSHARAIKQIARAVQKKCCNAKVPCCRRYCCSLVHAKVDDHREAGSFRFGLFMTIKQQSQRRRRLAGE